MKLDKDTIKDYEYLMSLCLEEAELAFNEDEVPVGACLVDSEGKLLAKSHNKKELHQSSLWHAEIVVMNEVAMQRGNWRLSDCTLFTTLEPCLMCLGAMVNARIGGLVFGAYDAKAGAMSLGYSLNKDIRLNHRFPAIGGLKHYECSKLLSQYFKQKRKFKN
jgi:tRNA(adenine34) deaminase